MYVPKNGVHPPPDGYAEKFEAAEILGISPSTFMLWHRQGRLIRIRTLWDQPPRTPRRRVYSIADLEREKLRLQHLKRHKVRLVRRREWSEDRRLNDSRRDEANRTQYDEFHYDPRHSSSYDY